VTGAPAGIVDLADGDGDGFRWQVWIYEDGTAQLVRRWPDRTIVGATGRRPAAEVRAEMARRGVPGDAWPE
jgi:hypothetical protein